MGEGGDGRVGGIGVWSLGCGYSSRPHTRSHRFGIPISFTSCRYNDS